MKKLGIRLKNILFRLREMYIECFVINPRVKTTRLVKYHPVKTDQKNLAGCDFWFKPHSWGLIYSSRVF
jgi:hypothetical protein